ncbi:class I SAM-dependent methyltransferase [Stella sp.]|uniref:class I SAM-dependent methyltransferase n=1 Tax=Stella sp. TaxID=2912054 RepID=UPI0035B3542F
MDRESHWQGVYGSKAETAVSWYEAQPRQSLDLIRRAAPDGAAGVIDVGGGASTLVDHLLAAGYRDLTVLDISDHALARAKARLGAAASRVAWIVTDVTRWQPARTWDVWHDRAVFHFLTAPDDQDAYLAALRAALAPGAFVILATFAPDGPERCSGLPVQRYDAAMLAHRLGPGFALVAAEAATHTTPWGVEQRFTHTLFRRTLSMSGG